MIQEFIERYISKKSVLITAVVATILFLGFTFPGLLGICGEYEANCQIPYMSKSLALLWAPALLVLSLITYPFSKKVFNTWIMFAIPWLILSVIIILATPMNLSLHGSNPKGEISLSLTKLFLILSLVIVIVRSTQLKLKK